MTKIFVFLLKWQQLDTTWIFHILNKTWTEGPRLNEKRIDHACLVDRETGYLYVIGGAGESGGSLKTTEKWDFGAGSWLPSVSLPEALKRSSAVTSNSMEYVGYLTGGQINGVTTSKLWALRRRDMSWIELPKTLKTPRRFHTTINIPSNEIPGC